MIEILLGPSLTSDNCLSNYFTGKFIGRWILELEEGDWLFSAFYFWYIEIGPQVKHATI